MLTQQKQRVPMLRVMRRSCRHGWWPPTPEQRGPGGSEPGETGGDQITKGVCLTQELRQAVGACQRIISRDVM